MLDTFMNRMKTYMNTEDFEAFKATFDAPVTRYVRVNPLRINVSEFKEIFPFPLQETTVSNYHFAVGEEVSGNHPYHLGGLFYMQDASAGCAVEAMHIQEGDRVLDLCAAPGGKSTQISGYLNQTGFLVSNEYVKNRAQILLSNTERIGARNTLVVNEHPQKLCSYYEGVFNKVLVDAPCSGEGMFHKDKEAIDHWSLEHVDSCAKRQKEILDSAYVALANGGELVYSTCTFSLQENEYVIRDFLLEHPDMELIDPMIAITRPGIEVEGINHTLVRRIYPMDTGEGHFIARMRKSGECESRTYKCIKGDPVSKEITSFLMEQLSEEFYKENKKRFFMVDNSLYYWNSQMPAFDDLHIVRCGVLCGSIEKNHFRPHHHFYMAFADQLAKKIDLDIADERVLQYLKGHEITCNEVDWNGYGAVCVHGHVLGFIKKSKDQCKNHYPKGLRLV